MHVGARISQRAGQDSMGRDFLDDVRASVGQGGGGTERDRQPGQQEHWKRERGRDRSIPAQ